MDDEARELLVRIDERVKALHERVDRIENRLENINVLLLKNGNRWRERGFMAGVATLIVALAETIRRLVSGV
jgi:tetrahydromethanopterin S-methyltransferase subunit G